MPRLIDLLMGYRGPLDLLPQDPYGLGKGTGYGLQGAQISPYKSPYEPTLAPGETRSAESLRAMLGDVILAAGSAAVPGIGPHEMAKRNPGGISWKEAYRREKEKAIASEQEPAHKAERTNTAPFASLLGQQQHLADLDYQTKLYRALAIKADATPDQIVMAHQRLDDLSAETSATLEHIKMLKGSQ